MSVIAGSDAEFKTMVERIYALARAGRLRRLHAVSVPVYNKAKERARIKRQLAKAEENRQRKVRIIFEKIDRLFKQLSRDSSNGRARVL